MLLSICITTLVVPAVLVMLLCVLATHFYTMAVPQGQNAMGLALPFLAIIAAAVALLLATLLSFLQGPPWWINSAIPARHFMAVVITSGIALASFGTFIAWTEHWGPWIPPAALMTGVGGPLLLGGILLAAAWKPLPELHGFALHRALAPAIGLVALAGYGMAAVMAARYWNHHQANLTRAAASESIEAAERARRRSLSPVEALHEDFAKMSDQAPLWVFIARLPDESDAKIRAMIIERAQNVPDFTCQVASTLSDAHPRYRHGTLILILSLAPRSQHIDWVVSLREAIAITNRQIASNPTWLTPDSFSNSDPVGHIRCLVRATRTIDSHDDSIKNALLALRATIESASPHPQASECLAAIDEPLPQTASPPQAASPIARDAN